MPAQCGTVRTMETTDTPKLRLLSLGAGVQSTALAIMAAVGDLEPLDGAIFSDTGWEPRAVYDHLDRLEREVLAPAGIPLYRVTSGNIRNDALDPDHRFASMPLFVLNPPTEEPVYLGTEPCPERCGWLEWRNASTDDGWAVETLDGQVYVQPVECETCDSTGAVPHQVGTKRVQTKGMARRQCTSEYKLKPIKRQVRELLGFPHPIRVPKGVYVEQWVGISRDEFGRAKDSDVRYSRNRFPLLELDMSRDDCMALLEAHGWGSTTKSACIGCPFHGNAQWRDLRDNHPDEWADAVAFDKAIRNGSAHANAKGQELRGSMYLHASCVPLDQAPIDRATRAERKAAEGDLFTELAEREHNDVSCGPFSCRGSDLDSNLPESAVVDLGMPALI